MNQGNTILTWKRVSFRAASTLSHRNGVIIIIVAPNFLNVFAFRIPSSAHHLQNVWVINVLAVARLRTINLKNCTTENSRLFSRGFESVNHIVLQFQWYKVVTKCFVHRVIVGRSCKHGKLEIITVLSTRKKTRWVLLWEEWSSVAKLRITCITLC